MKRKSTPKLKLMHCMCCYIPMRYRDRAFYLTCKCEDPLNLCIECNKCSACCQCNKTTNHGQEDRLTINVPSQDKEA